MLCAQLIHTDLSDVRERAKEGHKEAVKRRENSGCGSGGVRLLNTTKEANRIAAMAKSLAPQWVGPFLDQLYAGQPETGPQQHTPRGATLALAGESAQGKLSQGPPLQGGYSGASVVAGGGQATNLTLRPRCIPNAADPWPAVATCRTAASTSARRDRWLRHRLNSPPKEACRWPTRDGLQGLWSQRP